jgi:hypothetical protein
MGDPCFLGPSRNRTRPTRIARQIVINVYFHILTNRAGEGAVPRNVIEHQIRILNDAFAGNGVYGNTSPFQFRLVDTDTRQNDQWFNMEYSELSPTQAERDAKRALNKPGNSTLNIYTAGLSTHGWARWPWQLADRIDGVVVRYSTLPGGATPYYNTGDVVVHEVGHWIGLFHTSERGCNPPGDCVEDTAPEAYLKTACNTGDDSCPGGAADPYWNLMNYTYDECRYLFTRGQIIRMEAIFRRYRI